MSGTLDFLELATHQTIAEIMARHRAELAPYFKVLADIEAIRPSPPMRFDTATGSFFPLERLG
jgi:hypothetical protein